MQRILPLLAVLAVSGGTFLPAAHAKPAAKSKAAKPKAATIKWQPTFAAALKEAKRTKKPIFVDFYTTWCGPCKMLDQYTYTHRDFIAESKNWVMVKVDAEKNKANVELALKYGVTGYPTMALLRPNGSMFNSYSGFWEARSLVKELKASAKKARV